MNLEKKYARLLRKMGEKHMIEKVESNEEIHEFSDSYLDWKKQFLETSSSESKRWKNNVLKRIAVIAVLIPVVSVSAYAAGKYYNTQIRKNGYQIGYEISQEENVPYYPWVRLDLGYIPENMTKYEHGDKYSYNDNPNNGGFSFCLWMLQRNADFEFTYVVDSEIKEINGHEALFIGRDEGWRQVLILFDDYGYLLEAFVGADVPDEDLEKVLANISLVPATAENATSAQVYSNFGRDIAEAALNAENENVTIISNSDIMTSDKETMRETYIAYDEELASFDISGLEVKDISIAIKDSLTDEEQKNLVPYILEKLKDEGRIDGQGNLLPYNREIIKAGDGITTLDTVERVEEVKSKILYITFKVKNENKQDPCELYFTPLLVILEKDGEDYRFINQWGEGGVGYASASGDGYPDYNAAPGEGKAYYATHFEPNEEKEITVGYIVDEEQLEHVFLKFGPETGVTLTANGKPYKWLKLIE